MSYSVDFSPRGDAVAVWTVMGPAGNTAHASVRRPGGRFGPPHLVATAVDKRDFFSIMVGVAADGSALALVGESPTTYPMTWQTFSLSATGSRFGPPSPLTRQVTGYVTQVLFGSGTRGAVIGIGSGPDGAERQGVWHLPMTTAGKSGTLEQVTGPDDPIDDPVGAYGKARCARARDRGGIRSGHRGRAR